jgi:hypothetical protein
MLLIALKWLLRFGDVPQSLPDGKNSNTMNR